MAIMANMYILKEIAADKLALATSIERYLGA
jgi:hypothetical protein